jgi:hypothetical protein
MNMNKLYVAIGLITLSLAMSALCQTLEVEAENPISISRQSETISISWKQILGEIEGLSKDNISVFDIKNKQFLVIQIIDSGVDKRPDALLFQSDFKPKEKRSFRIMKKPEGFKELEPEKKTFCRFVPERDDDFAWENDLVAFRVYGPRLYKHAVNSGIDCWLKRVDYPIINKWYKENAEGKSYHKDHGEGHDPYHVGSSRGCGGLVLWENDKMLPSNVFDSWKIIANGPIRSVFELTYDKSWKTSGKNLSETKRITIDLGQRVFRIDSFFSDESGPQQVVLAVGITTHDGKAVGDWNKKAGVMQCWETIKDSELGTGVVMDQSRISEIKEIKSKKKDTSHIVVITSTDKKGWISYYTGYGWKKAKKITTSEEWNEYLNNFAKGLKSPVKVTIK